MKLVDTHVHLDDEKFEGDRRGVVARASAAGVAAMVAIATTADSSDQTVQLADSLPGVFAAVGIQPNHTSEASDEHWLRIRELALHPRVVAIGETGLDHYWDFAPLDVQRLWFTRHIELSMELGLPMVIHMREGKHGDSNDSCCREIIDVIRKVSRGARVAGVMHSYTGTHERALELLDMGLYISFAGMVTFKSAGDLRSIASAIPNDRLLVETDAPYLTPEPLRGRSPNEPALVVHTAQCLAQVRRVSLDELAACTTANACQLFRDRGSFSVCE